MINPCEINVAISQHPPFFFIFREFPFDKIEIIQNIYMARIEVAHFAHRRQEKWKC